MDYFAAVAVSCISRTGMKKQRESLFLPSRQILRYITAEEDIRIASRPAKKTDPGETSAADFYTQQNMGNIQTAIQLGGCLARLYCGHIQRLEEQEPVLGQLAILYSYAVNRAIQTLPNSLIAQTVLSTFYNMVKQESADLYQAVRDPIPFSLYILRDKRIEPSESYGEIFASLCGRRDDRELVDLANQEYESFYQECILLSEGFSFQAISQVSHKQ